MLRIKNPLKKKKEKRIFMQTKFLYIQFINCLLRTRARGRRLVSTIIDCNIYRWLDRHRLSIIFTSSVSQKFRRMKKKKKRKNIPEQSLHNRTRLTGIIYVLSGVDDISELLFSERRMIPTILPNIRLKRKKRKKERKEVNNLFRKIISSVNCYKSP